MPYGVAATSKCDRVRAGEKLFSMQRCCRVSFHHRGGEYSNTTMGGSLFDAAANALDFFCAPHWKGPRPQRDTVLDVITLGDQGRYRVLAGRFERWAFKRLQVPTGVSSPPKRDWTPGDLGR